jgi:arginine utilization protein RocB
MRANSPVEDDGFSVLAPVEDLSPLDQIDELTKALAKEVQSKSGSIILDHLQKQIDVQKKVMFGTHLDNMSTEEVGNQTRASMKVIAVLESIIEDCEIAVNQVKRAAASEKTI